MIPSLKQGDHVAIIAPARKIAKEELLASIALFESFGLRVRLGKHIFGSHNQYSGSDEERAADFQAALDDREIKAIFCARGGYGGMRIVDLLDFSLFKKYPKWICGYSDTTVFHTHIHSLGFPTLHCTMPFNIDYKSFENTSVKTMMHALFNNEITHEATPHLFNKTGTAKGIVCGGNLSLLYAVNGSVSDIDTKGKILFIEDLDEYLYHIDRMMLSLKRSGKLSQLSGLIVGGMTEMNDNLVSFGKTAEEIILEHVEEYDYPVCFHFPAGHIADNRAIIFGKEAAFTVAETYVKLKI